MLLEQEARGGEQDRRGVEQDRREEEGGDIVWRNTASLRLRAATDRRICGRGGGPPSVVAAGGRDRSAKLRNCKWI